MKNYHRSIKNHITKKSEDISSAFPCKGRRIIDVEYMAQNSQCCNCNSDLSLKNIKDEKIEGLHSTFSILCTECSSVTRIATGKKHQLQSKKTSFHNDNTTKGILGTLHAGIGNTELNKVLSCLSVPEIHPDMYKKYEREVGPAIEAVARQSCRKAAKEERQQVIEKVEVLRHEL